MRGIAAALVVVALLGCEEVDVPVGPPRCEPEHEHELDRRLKLAFKALVLGERDEALALFQALLAEEPMHPEAQLGLRIAQGKQAIDPEPPRPRAPAFPNGSAPGGLGPDMAPGGAAGVHRTLFVAGEGVPVELAIDSGRWRFEELRALAPLRKARDGAGATFDFYAPRTLDGAPVEATPAGVGRAIDLVVLHDSHTRTAREAVVELEGRGSSTHFIIDWDGAVFQTLDLVWEANHTQIRAVDARSVSVDLVNPVELGNKPGLPDEAEDRGEHRPLSEFVVVQGDEVQQWGYTEAQLASLTALLRALGKQLPRLPLVVPESGGKTPRAVLDAPEEMRGVVGHLHMTRRAQDPGAGFPWETLGKALRP